MTALLWTAGAVAYAAVLVAFIHAIDSWARRLDERRERRTRLRRLGAALVWARVSTEHFAAAAQRAAVGLTRLADAHRARQTTRYVPTHRSPR